MTTKATDEKATDEKTTDEKASDYGETKKPAAGSIVIIGGDWKPTGKTFPKPESGYPHRFVDPDDPNVLYEAAGIDEVAKTRLYRIAG